MKIKKEYLILFVVIVAAIVYLATHRSDRSHYELPQIARIDPKEIEKIEIETAATTIQLLSKDGVWEIAPKGYPVDQSKSDRILETIAELNLTAMVSESENYIRYELDPPKRIRVRAWQGSQLVREFDIGKAADTFRHTFVRLADDARVFHASDNFRSRFDASADELRDKAVLNFKPEEIQKFRLTKNGVETLFEREPQSQTKAEGEDNQETTPEQDIWRSGDGQQADTRKITALLSTLSELRCQGYLEDKLKSDFQSSAIEIALEGPDAYGLQVFPQTEADGEQWPAVSSQNDYVFLLDSWKVEEMQKDLMPDPPEPESEEKTAQ